MTLKIGISNYAKLFQKFKKKIILFVKKIGIGKIGILRIVGIVDGNFNGLKDRMIISIHIFICTHSAFFVNIEQ